MPTNPTLYLPGTSYLHRLHPLSKLVEAGIEVVEGYCGAGFAKDCTRAWAREMRKRDLIPLWSTTWENEASQAIAARLGFEMYGTDWHLA